jgi:hypothetical protein
MAPISVFHSRFFAPLRSSKRAPFKPGRNSIAFKQSVILNETKWSEESLKIKLRFFLRQNDKL